MASTQAFCTSFKSQLLSLGWASTDVIKMALYTQAGQTGFGPATTVYTSTGELASGNGYTTGGATMAGLSTGITGTTGYLDWTTDPAWPSSTLTTDMALLYNSTRTNAAMAVLLFTSTSSTNGTLTVQLPAPGTTAIITIV